MEAFLVIPEQAPHIPDIFAAAGRQARGKGEVANFMSRLPKDIAEELKAHSIYISDLKERGKILFACVTDDFKDAFIVYGAEDLKEVKYLAEGDPFFKNNIFTGYKITRLHHWL
jgi:uncharacterized protein YciI